MFATISSTFRARLLAPMAVLAASIGGPGGAIAQESPPADSTFVKLLKRAPADRMPAIIEVIGKRGDAADLAYLFDRLKAPAWGARGQERLRAIEALADASEARGLRPKGSTEGLGALLDSPDLDPPTLRAMARLAATWKSLDAVDGLAAVVARPGLDPSTRSAAFDALASIGGDRSKATIRRVAADPAASPLQPLAIAALARVDIDEASGLAADLIGRARPGQDLAPLVGSFLDRQGGADKLAGALDRRPPPPDPAKLALRAVYALGRSDERLVVLLSKAAGLAAEPRPPTADEMASLVAEVGRSGDPARGEAIFRRVELNCMKCHALEGAGGGVGPDLSSVGGTSPVDYLVNSIVLPDQAIKEAYETRVVVTDDGRVLQGIVEEEDDRRVVLKDATGERRMVPRSSIEDSKRGGSLMPRGLAGLLTRAEFVDLVRFLSELGRPGPYAIRPTPSIRRWRVLHPTPSALLDPSAAPNPDAIQAEILAAPPDRWLPAYSWVSGDLPVAEAVALAGAPVVFLQGEVVVSSAGPIRLRVDGVPAPSVMAWADDRPIGLDQPDGSAELGEGTHRLTVRVDASKIDAGRSIRADLLKPIGSSAEFSVVGGR